MCQGNEVLLERALDTLRCSRGLSGLQQLEREAVLLRSASHCSHRCRTNRRLQGTAVNFKFAVKVQYRAIRPLGLTPGKLIARPGV
jgi:hypothetical protein